MPSSRPKVADTAARVVAFAAMGVVVMSLTTADHDGVACAMSTGHLRDTSNPGGSTHAARRATWPVRWSRDRALSDQGTTTIRPPPGGECSSTNEE
jgi:hypothetical protein